MPSFLSVLLCCDSGTGRKDSKSEHRCARLVETNPNNVYHEDHRSSQQYSQLRRLDGLPAYNDIVHDPLITISDEKDTTRFELVVNNTAESSPRSSVISVPSTRVTGLTSMPTGSTSERSSSIRRSMYESRPPSYESERNGSIEVQEVAYTIRTSNEHAHPVMAANWLDVLRSNVVRRTSHE